MSTLATGSPAADVLAPGATDALSTGSLAANSAGSLVQSVDWLAIAPAAIPAVIALLVLVADLFLPKEKKALLGWFTIGGLALAALALVPLRHGERRTFCLTTRMGECSYVADHFTIIVQLLVIGGALLTALLSMHTMDELPAGEYWFLLLSSAAGAALLPASRDLATLVVALEVATLPAFALVGIKRGDRLSSEAALKFFLSSVAATAVTLLGVSFVYAATGTLHLASIADALGDVQPQLAILAKVGAALTLVGFAFKLAVAPFHFWVPDTYVGAPLPIAAYLSVVGKAAGFSGLILVTVIAFEPLADVWGPVVAVLAALTMTVGNVAALRQRAGHAHSAVRLLAWSSIGQAGYLLVPIAAAAHSDDPAHQIGTTVAYALMYAAVNLGAFAVAALVARTAPSNRLTDYRGLYATHPLAALAMAFFLLCLAGLPPGIIGLFAKVAVFSSIVGTGPAWLAVVMAVNVVIALVYYLRWTAILFAKPEPALGVDAATDAVTDAVTPAAGTGAGVGGGVGAGVGAGLGGGVAVATASATRTPVPLTAAIALTAALGIVLSGVPQLVLRYASGVLL
ncbi:NADH-quinone oxidoreductase subunit N [Streptomyces sp. H10-C2]|uniref:NADH-quinone oxidoreductase subunit N n=1 Tax=unclassified Streptomyces TaxID=2593676 RepID=UPI0024BBE752|nr:MULTISPECIES: NADH-quinone oxidoreductase subunit N [unclassified Streptomyces]MDJ0346282.1 NADH-quinone oxidoreductase subunit N [Streptomyces sp. PH10-H1]MDJ0375270.1 NADH-quinone oxidoreductase subunit N [Streptomyces sp. H10-C2]